jgi:hypothetical protein
MMNDRRMPGPEMMSLQTPNLNLTLDKTDPMVCTSCKGEVFVEGVMFRRISKILAGTDKDAILPINVFYCSKCNTILDELLPNELRKPKLSV